jgi:hypothetical protein
VYHGVSFLIALHSSVQKTVPHVCDFFVAKMSEQVVGIPQQTPLGSDSLQPASVFV